MLILLEPISKALICSCTRFVAIYIYYHSLCKSLKVVTSLRRNTFSTNCCSKTILLQRLLAMQLSLKI